MADRQVTCVIRAGGAGHEHITHVGGSVGAQAEPWQWPLAEVVSSIENGDDSFFVLVGETRKEIAVARAAGMRTVRAFAAKKWTDDLLALPACV